MERKEIRTTETMKHIEDSNEITKPNLAGVDVWRLNLQTSKPKFTSTGARVAEILESQVRCRWHLQSLVLSLIEWSLFQA